MSSDDLEIRLEDDHARVFNAFEPLEPASVDQYLDMDAVRGTESGIVKAVLKQIRLCRDQYGRFLFSGHIGCGKSSELKHLEHVLLHRKPKEGETRFFPIFIDTFEYLSDYDADAIDLLLAVVAELASRLREDLQIELTDNYFKDRFIELRNFLLRDVSLDEGELALWNVKVKLKLLKANDVARNQIREALRPRVTTILGEINNLLTTARALLIEKKTGYSDVILIVDNLEKIRKVTNAAEGFASHRELFLEQHAKLTGFNAHVIYTVPLRLMRSSDSPQLMVRYPHIHIVPSVKVAERNHEPFKPGRDALRKLVERRVKPSSLGAIFHEDALEFMLDYCGGHVRHLMIFARSAVAYADELPVDLAAAKQALKQMIFSRTPSRKDNGTNSWRWKNRRIRRSQMGTRTTFRFLRTPPFWNTWMPMRRPPTTNCSTPRCPGTRCIRSFGACRSFGSGCPRTMRRTTAERWDERSRNRRSRTARTDSFHRMD
ncbi:MAG TPA: hypothetical protein VJ901_02315 [Thermoanaerobaculia bacterium]|nr:hypothetical protein [Thermoanaerobaculia bacterium]